MQGKPKKTKQKGLEFLVFPWPNLDFSMGYSESKEKIRPTLGKPVLVANARASHLARRLVGAVAGLSRIEFLIAEIIAAVSSLRNEMSRVR
jgi:hypothetical protein